VEKIFWGWSGSDICPNCGGKLILAKKHKKLSFKEDSLKQKDIISGASKSREF
jgi:hypothetical protein